MTAEKGAPRTLPCLRLRRHPDSLRPSSNEVMTDTRLLFPGLTDMFKQILGDRIDQSAADFLELFTEDGVMEFPYALEGRPKRVAGRAALAEYLGSLNDRLAIDSNSEPVVHWTRDPICSGLSNEGRVGVLLVRFARRGSGFRARRWRWLRGSRSRGQE